MKYNIKKGDQVFLTLAKIVVEVDEIWYLDDMPMDRGLREGWYFNGEIVADYNPQFEGETGRVGEWCTSIAHDAIGGVVANPKQENKVWFPIEKS